MSIDTTHTPRVFGYVVPVRRVRYIVCIFNKNNFKAKFITFDKRLSDPSRCLVYHIIYCNLLYNTLVALLYTPIFIMYTYVRLRVDRITIGGQVVTRYRRRRHRVVRS